MDCSYLSAYYIYIDIIVVGRYGIVLIFKLMYIDIAIIVVGRYGFVLIIKRITSTLTLLS